jgi:hypothetical protein
LCWNDGDSKDGQRVRAFNEWVRGEWLTNYNNTNPGLNNVAAASHANLLKQEYGGDSGDEVLFKVYFPNISVFFQFTCADYRVHIA